MSCSDSETDWAFRKIAKDQGAWPKEHRKEQKLNQLINQQIGQKNCWKRVKINKLKLAKSVIVGVLSRATSILEILREEIEENKPTMSKKGELFRWTRIIAIGWLIAPRKPFDILYEEPINFTANDKRSQEEQGLRK